MMNSLPKDYRSKYNSYHWNKIKVLGVERKSRYRNWIWIYVHSVWLKWNRYDWIEMKKITIENKSLCGLYINDIFGIGILYVSL